jgi:hypothetical protein
VQITLEQTQVNKKEGIPLFNFAIEIDIQDAEGRCYTSLVSFNGDSSKEIAIIPIGAAKPFIIEIDPRGKILHSLEFNPGETILGNMAKSGKEISTRIHSYRELCKVIDSMTF